MVFAVPIASWFRGPYRALVEELVLGPRARERELFEPSAVQTLVRQHQRGEGNHAQRLWALLNLELWFRLHVDGEAADTVGETVARYTPPATHGARPTLVA